MAYAAGARIHSNSWGSNEVNGYDSNSFDVDHFSYSNSDFLAVFSAGNFAVNGFHSVMTPGYAKNCLCVGASFFRTVLTDETDASYSSVAYFSSLGPTADGRFKPDVVAPGMISSAVSASESKLLEAQAANVIEDPSCAVVEYAGTSTATPVTAGTLLLVREYFMGSVWTQACNREYSCCRDGAFEPSGYFLKVQYRT